MRQFSKATTERLGAYVYMLVDPRDELPFYVGKGRGNRIFQHIENAYADLDAKKSKLISEIMQEGKDIRHFVVRHGLSDEEAFHAEAALIDALGIENLSNIQRGHGTREHGMVSVLDLFAKYEATDAMIDFPAVVFKINRMYKPGMTRAEIYEAGRGIWKIAWERHLPKYAIISAPSYVPAK